MKSNKAKTYYVGGGVSASTYLGTIKAKSREEAIERGNKLWEEHDCGVCHQCSDKVSDPETVSLHVYCKEEGEEVYSASNDGKDEIIKNQGQKIEKLEDMLFQACKMLQESNHIDEKLFGVGDYDQEEFLKSSEVQNIMDKRKAN